MISPNVNIYTIIVTYNGMQWVDACFGSLRGSTVPLHTVVVDNGSTDGTPQRIAERFPEVHLIRSDENLGFGRGNNVGIRYALGQGATHFFLLNQDAWIYPDTVERLLGAEDDRSGILSPVHLDGSAERMDEAFKRYLFGDAAATRDDGLLLGGLTSPREARFINAAAWLLPLRTIEAVGGFDPLFLHYGEDNNYCQRVLHQSLTIRVVPQALVCHDRKSAARPLRNAWVGRYLLITYADPRFSPWQATRRTLRRQAATLARVPYYLLRGDGKSASEILKAYRTLLRRREGRDIWQGLYEFPLIETERPAELPELVRLPQFRELLGDVPWHLVRSIPLPKHQLSHQTLHAVVHRIETPSLMPAAAAMAVPTVALGDYAVPRLIDLYLIKYQI